MTDYGLAVLALTATGILLIHQFLSAYQDKRDKEIVFYSILLIGLVAVGKWYL